MKNFTTLLFVAVAALSIVGCSGGDGGENAAEVTKMAKEPVQSNNPDVPTIDSKNGEFGPKSGGGKALGGM